MSPDDTTREALKALAKQLMADTEFGLLFGHFHSALGLMAAKATVNRFAGRPLYPTTTTIRTGTLAGLDRYHKQGDNS